MRKLFFLLITITIFTNVLAHSPRPRYHIIIDTDGATDDFRAISYLLSANDVRTLLIIGSSGSVDAQTSAQKVYELLVACHNEGIEVGINNSLSIELPPWANFCKNFAWADAQQNQQFADYLQLLYRILNSYKNKITLIALGSLNSYANFIRQFPELKSKIEKIIWYNDKITKNGFNYQIDTKSYDFIVESGIPLTIVSNERNDLVYNEELAIQIKEAKTIYAHQIFEYHQKSNFANNHNSLILWDDLVALYIANPMIFDIETPKNITYASIQKNIPFGIIAESFKDILNSSYNPNNRAFLTFPTDTSLYISSVAQKVNKIVEKYGIIEWKAVVMTNEVHGHTGVYSIVGAKMGIRALEYFNVGVNNLEVTTFAGKMPPLSCFNDGIQTATGSTVGQGLLTVADSVVANPTAIFEFNGQKVKMQLKPDITAYIEKQVAYAYETWGLASPLYWLYIEKIAYQIWFNYSRYEMFEIKKL